MVPLPGRTTFYRLIEALSIGRHTFGSAVTRRQAANRPVARSPRRWHLLGDFTIDDAVDGAVVQRFRGYTPMLLRSTSSRPSNSTGH